MNQPNQCEIARDLMPLAVDGVCSEGSQRFLDGHVASCPPCQAVYARMKTAPMTAHAAGADREDAALRRGLKRLGQRFRGLWTALVALAAAFALLLVVAGVNQVRWHWVSNAPLDSYQITLYRNDALFCMNLCADFPQQTYKDFRCETRTVGKTDENRTGMPEAVILTCSVRYLPAQAKDFMKHVTVDTAEGYVAPEGVQLSKPVSNFRYATGLETLRLCVDDGKLYLIDSKKAVQADAGRTLMLLEPGLPVSEICVTDGRDTVTLYTWGDEIVNYATDSVDEYGLPESGLISPTDYERLREVLK